MPIKVSGTAKVNRKLKKLLPDARSSFAIEMKKTILKIIKEKIQSGVSPVKGQNKYPNYSDAYAKKKGRKAPVDLTDKGDMLDDLKAVQKKNGDIVLEFKTAKERKKAYAHNNGKGNQPMRKMLPSKRGEKFKQHIMDKITRAAKLAIRLATQKFTK
jgi:hypothetical protein